MGKATVRLIATAHQWVKVEIDDEKLKGLSESEKEELYLDQAYAEMQEGICAGCSGFGSNFTIDLDEWEPVDENPVEIRE
jgi:hypothetical protein